MNNQLSLASFRAALEETSKIKAQLKPFFVEFKNNNVHLIIQTIQQLNKYLTDKNVDLHLAFNSLFAVKFIIDKADFIILSMVEAYLLPRILQIAAFELNKENKNRGDTYFVSKGFKGNNKQLQYYGFNFVRIACELIMVSASIKPNKLVFNQQINDPSDFQLAFRKLKLKGFKPYQSLVFYKKQVIQQARNNFVANLAIYQKDIVFLQQYTKTFLKSYLIKGTETSSNIHLLKLVQKGEATLSSLTLQICFQSLKSNNLKERRRALKIINNIVKWGDILAYFYINFKKPVQQAIQQIGNLEGNIQKEVGFASLRHYYNNESQKRLYYTSLLENIRFWSQCYPQVINCPSQVSRIKFLAGQLEKSGILLPKTQKLFIQKAQFVQNSQKRQETNEALKRIFLFRQFQQEITKIWDIMKILQCDKSKTKDHFPFLSDFYKTYDLKMANSSFSEDDILQIKKFATPLIQILQKLVPAFQKYLEGRISYQQFFQQVTFKKNALNSSRPQIRKIIAQHNKISEDRKSKFNSPKLNKKDIYSAKIDELLSKFSQTQLQQELPESGLSCYVISRPIESLIQFNNQQARTFKAMNPQISISREQINLQQSKRIQQKNQNPQVYKDFSFQVDGDLLKNHALKKKEQNAILLQSSEILCPEFEPQEQSHYIQNLQRRDNSFLGSLAADKDQLLHSKRQSSLKLINYKQQPILRKSIEKESRLKSTNNKFKELLRSGTQMSKLILQNRVAKWIDKTQSYFKNSDKVTANSNANFSTGIPQHQKFNEFFQFDEGYNINQKKQTKEKIS